jgi:hypothetical protein
MMEDVVKLENINYARAIQDIKLVTIEAIISNVNSH